MTFITCNAPNLQKEVSSCSFYPITNGFTDAPSIKPYHASWNVTWTVLIQIRFCFIACIQIQSFRGRFIFLHLSTLPRSNFPGSHGAKKHYRLVLFRARVLQSLFHFSFMAYVNRTTSLKNLETELTNITRRHFCSLPFLYWTFFYLLYLFTFSYRNFFPLFVCFDILWQLPTTHTRDHTRDRNANSSRQNDVTWCDFFTGKTCLALALSLAFAAENIKNLPLRLRVREKNLSSTCRQVWCSHCTKVWHKSYPISEAPRLRQVCYTAVLTGEQRTAAEYTTFEIGAVQLVPSQKPSHHNRSCVWTGALSVLIFMGAQRYPL